MATCKRLTAKFLFLALTFACFANCENELYGSDYNSNNYNGKERLQIEGTELRGVEEGSSSRYNRANSVNGDNNFNNYWARLNWGRPRTAPTWTEESRRRIHWRPSTSKVEAPKTTIQKRSRNAQNSEAAETAAAAVQTAAASSAIVAYNPEVEMIDSSRISADLANLRFMRMEEVKEPGKEAGEYATAEKEY